MGSIKKGNTMKIIRIMLLICAVLAVGLFVISEIVGWETRDPVPPQLSAETDLIEVPCAYTRQDLMKGIRAWDEEDGDLTDEVVLSTFSRFLEDGVCNLTYVVFDDTDQAATLTRKVRFIDYHAPRFTLVAPLVYEQGQGSYNQIVEALGAQDVLDGDRTEWIVRTATNLNFQTVGTYSVSFEVSNSFGDSSSVQLPVHVIPTQIGEGGIALNTGLVYLEKGQSLDPAQYIQHVTAADGSEIDPAAVQVSSQVNSQMAGCYEVHYEAEDFQGNHYETWLTVIVEGGAT